MVSSLNFFGFNNFSLCLPRYALTKLIKKLYRFSFGSDNTVCRVHCVALALPNYPDLLYNYLNEVLYLKWP